MKASKILLLTSLLVLSSCNSNFSAKADDLVDITLENAVATKMKSTLRGSLKLDATCNSTIGNYRFVDEVSASRRTSKTYINYKLAESYYAVKNNDGYAAFEYIDRSNKIGLREIKDDNDVNIRFDTLYPHPFKLLYGLSTEKINEYFIISESENGGYILKADDKAYGILSSYLLTFYPDVDSYHWDSKTLSYLVDNLTFTLLEDGTPTNFSFDKIKKDNFGGYKSSYKVTIDSIEEVSFLTPANPLMNQTQLDEFNTLIDGYQDKLDAGNFTIAVDIDLAGMPFQYNIYYELDNHIGPNSVGPLVISSLLLIGEYGRTYTGARYILDGYYQYAVSPDADKAAQMNSVKRTYEGIIPSLTALSGDFFTADNGKYTFDISSFSFPDYYFQYSILTALLSEIEGAIYLGGIYEDPSSPESLSLQDLTFEDVNNNLKTTLNFEVLSEPCRATFTYKNFGTTDIESAKDIPGVVATILDNGE